MRIALVSQIFPVREQPYRGHSVYQTALRLARTSDLAAFSPHPDYRTKLRPRPFAAIADQGDFQPEGLSTTYLRYRAIPGLSRPVNGYVCSRALDSPLRAFKPDIILAYWLYPDGFASVLAARRLGIPAVVKAIGTDFNDKHDVFTTRLTAWTLKRADRVLTVSQDMAKQMVANGVPAAKVVPVLNGCDKNIFFPSVESSGPGQRILFVGRLERGKGLQELISALPFVRRHVPGVHLHIVGQGPLRDELRQQASELRLADCIAFEGVLPSRSIADFMRRCDVLALPSYAEGCPNVVIEALNCGLPVVASRVGGIPELVDEESGMLTRPREVESLSGALRDALSRQWDRRAIARRTQRSWEQVAQDTLAVCQDVLRRRTGQ